MESGVLRATAGLILAGCLGGCGLVGLDILRSAPVPLDHSPGTLIVVNAGTCTYTDISGRLREERVELEFSELLLPAQTIEIEIPPGEYREIEVSGPDDCLQTFFDVDVVAGGRVTLTLED